MENRDRDKLSKSSGSTSAGNVNRETSSDIGRSKSDSDASFGQNIGRSENLENEPSRRSGSVGSSGMKSGSSNRNSSSVGSEMESSSGSRRSGSLDSQKNSDEYDRDSERGSRH